MRKLEELSELQGLRKDVQRIAVALEKLAGIESQDSNEQLLSWPESEGEEMEVQESKEKGNEFKWSRGGRISQRSGRGKWNGGCGRRK